MTWESVRWRSAASLPSRPRTSSGAALARCGAEIDLDENVVHGPDATLAKPFEVHGQSVGNRFAILPMEGWDAEVDGKPSDLTRRRWRRFGRSGAKLIWGGEAVAVRSDGRANPDQLVICEANLAAIEGLREGLVDEHRASFGRDDDLLVGLQLTHSGRYARPNDKRRLEPLTLYDHPMLDGRLRADESAHILTDAEIARLVDDFVRAASQARRVGFAFVDIKHCHGYLGHEFLSSVDRPGRFGGSLENRTRFLREVVAGIRAEAPGLGGRRPAERGRHGPVPHRPRRRGVPETPPALPYRHAFGADPSDGLGVDLAEPSAFLTILESLTIRLVCTSAGTPYYNPHLLRPAAFPPSDGYLPPEDPLVGVARQIDATRRLKAEHPGLIFVGSGYTYLQEWLPNVAQRVVRDGSVDFVGLGRDGPLLPRVPLRCPRRPPTGPQGSLPDLQRLHDRPRNGMVSGCFPLDPFYKARPERDAIAEIRRQTSGGRPDA